MRLELDVVLFIVFLLGSLLFGYLYKILKSRVSITKLFFVLMSSLLLPAFIPGHGEIVIALPNGALFFKSSSLTWGIGFFYVLIYFSLIFLLLKNKSKNNL